MIRPTLKWWVFQHVARHRLHWDCLIGDLITVCLITAPLSQCVAVGVILPLVWSGRATSLNTRSSVIHASKCGTEQSSRDSVLQFSNDCETYFGDKVIRKHVAIEVAVFVWSLVATWSFSVTTQFFSSQTTRVFSVVLLGTLFLLFVLVATSELRLFRNTGDFHHVLVYCTVYWHFYVMCWYDCMNCRMFDCICRYEYVVPSYASLFNVSIDMCSFSGFYYNFYKIPLSLSCDKYTPLDDDATSVTSG